MMTPRATFEILLLIAVLMAVLVSIGGHLYQLAQAL